MGSSILDSMNQGYVVAGKITAVLATDAALTCNDGSATLTRNAAGDYTVTFGQAFLAAPVVTCSLLDATYATTHANGVNLIAVATNSAQFNISATALNATVGALADAGDIYFMAFGKRNK